MTNDEKLANETLALADEIETDAKREIVRIDALIGAATSSDDFDAIALHCAWIRGQSGIGGNCQERSTAHPPNRGAVGLQSIERDTAGRDEGRELGLSALLGLCPFVLP